MKGTSVETWWFPRSKNSLSCSIQTLPTERPKRFFCTHLQAGQRHNLENRDVETTTQLDQCVNYNKSKPIQTRHLLTKSTLISHSIKNAPYFLPDLGIFVEKPLRLGWFDPLSVGPNWQIFLEKCYPLSPQRAVDLHSGSRSHPKPRYAGIC